MALVAIAHKFTRARRKKVKRVHIVSRELLRDCFRKMQAVVDVEHVEPENIDPQHPTTNVKVILDDFGMLENLSCWQKWLLPISRCQQTSAKKFGRCSLVGGVLWGGQVGA